MRKSIVVCLMLLGCVDAETASTVARTQSEATSRETGILKVRVTIMHAKKN